jgi:hypothetical protein
MHGEFLDDEALFATVLVIAFAARIPDSPGEALVVRSADPWDVGQSAISANFLATNGFPVA